MYQKSVQRVLTKGLLCAILRVNRLCVKGEEKSTDERKTYLTQGESDERSPLGEGSGDARSGGDFDRLSDYVESVVEAE